MTTVGIRKGDLPDEDASGTGEVETGMAPESTRMSAAMASMPSALVCDAYRSSGVSSGPIALTALRSASEAACPTAPRGVESSQQHAREQKERQRQRDQKRRGGIGKVVRRIARRRERIHIRRVCSSPW
ncbi:hypothetical protein L1887_48920 [Cichorium endivia]|nr:hypothetical protein L1887_48920 [Cichorium endivia]